MHNRRISRGGFALPTVLIASVVMLTILAVSVSSVAAVRTTLKTQYYEQLAKAAGEAGVAFAKACLSKNGNVPLWTDAKPLRPYTDCAGNSTLSDEPFSSLVVAGGGSGGGGTGGGGGGGGVIETSFFALGTGAYPVVVGAGGAVPGNQQPGRDGANSSFNSVVAVGGGGGAYSAGGTSGAAGRPGGSGGGGQIYYGSYGPGAGTIGQGQAGGSISGIGSQSTTGGGGAGGPGLTTPVATGGGAGGPGKMSSLGGSALYYGGGGGGGGGVSVCGGSSGGGGIGGGGSGGDVGVAGVANTGGGGGGAWCYASGNGGAGGSGVVIITYPDSGVVSATGGNTVYSSGGYRTHIFRSGGTFTVTAVGTSSCPSDPRCSVLVNSNLRTSFSVARPTVDDEGRALTLPNSGYTELLRTSTGEVWRTYRQPSVQVAVVPDLCSGAATTPLGWSNAVQSTTTASLPNATAAENITLANNNLAAGRMYFRKDFTVTVGGTYAVRASTDTNSDVVEIYVDGQLRVTANGGIANGSVTLDPGCHTVTARLTNKTLLPRASEFIAAIQKDSSEPVVATDSSWRVSAGSSVYFSESDYYADPGIWTGVTDFEMANTVVGTWATNSGDPHTRLISAPCANTCPFGSSTYFRDSKDFVVSSNTEAVVSALCDDDCVVYVDGNAVIASSPWSNINQQTLTLTAGSHRIGVKLYNTGSVTNPAKFGVSVRNNSNGTILTRSDIKWMTSGDIWTAGYNTDNDPTSFEASFRPSPNEINDPATIDLLVAGGGGGGATNAAGGGGGGGVQFFENVPITVGQKNITVGTGGAGGANTNAAPGDGTYSQYVSTTYRSLGGGRGAPRSSTNIAASGGNGVFGSGGGGAGAYTVANHAGGLGTSQWQGGNGGSGTPMDQGCNARGGGGGGAGGAATAGVAAGAGGSGGPGVILYFTGSRLAIGGGGAGNGPTCGVSAGYATDGGQSTISASAPANSAGGGAAGTAAAGGAGGSGVVIIRFRTGLLSNITTSGSPVVTTTTVRGVGYTVYTFNASGWFNPGTVNTL